ncbi:uncharacterized protein V1518DRAFT_432273 [Limtongia smithiae]|uniref:uncharacterized protein n=1 Tax=Limtongia smithiae TaxID=1125753 RepID=UPI0034CE3FE0
MDSPISPNGVRYGDLHTFGRSQFTSDFVLEDDDAHEKDVVAAPAVDDVTDPSLRDIHAIGNVLLNHESFDARLLHTGGIGKAAGIKGADTGGTVRSSDSNKENLDPENAPDLALINIREEKPEGPPPFEVSIAVSEIMFTEPPSIRQMLTTSTLRIPRDASQQPRQSALVTSSSEQALFGCNTSSQSYPNGANVNRVKSFVITGDSLDPFLADEYVKRPHVGHRGYTLDMVVDGDEAAVEERASGSGGRAISFLAAATARIGKRSTGVGRVYFGGQEALVDVNLQVHRMRDGTRIRATNIEIAIVCYEQIKSTKIVLGTQRYRLLNSARLCNAGMNPIRHTINLPPNLGPGSLNSGSISGPQIRYVLFASAVLEKDRSNATASTPGTGRNVESCLLRLGREITYFPGTGIGAPERNRMQQNDVAKGWLPFGGGGRLVLYARLKENTDYCVAGRKCYVRVYVNNGTCREVTRTVVRLVREVTYQHSGVTKTRQQVMYRSEFCKSREGWPSVDAHSYGAFVVAVNIPETAVSIQPSPNVNVRYYMHVSAGGGGGGGGRASRNAEGAGASSVGEGVELPTHGTHIASLANRFVRATRLRSMMFGQAVTAKMEMVLLHSESAKKIEADAQKEVDKAEAEFSTQYHSADETWHTGPIRTPAGSFARRSFFDARRVPTAEAAPAPDPVPAATVRLARTTTVAAERSGASEKRREPPAAQRAATIKRTQPESARTATRLQQKTETADGGGFRSMRRDDTATAAYAGRTVMLGGGGFGEGSKCFL